AAADPGVSTARYLAASSPGEISASLLKYSLVVSFSLIGVRHDPSAATARDRWTTGLSWSGIDPCPDVPRAVSSIGRGIFSTVSTPANLTRPPTRVVTPPSARQYSALMS